MQARRVTGVQWLAIVLTAVALAAIAGWTAAGEGSWWDAWCPNIATSTLSIAVTITVVDHLLKREAERRLRPRTERVLYWIGLDFRLFASALVVDYASTHAETFKPIPADARDMINQWLEGQASEDLEREPLDDEWLPGLVLAAKEFHDGLKHARSQDLDVLEPELVRVIDDFAWRLGQAVQLFDLARHDAPSEAPKTHATALKEIVVGAKEFATVLAVHAPSWMAITELTRAAAEDISRRAQRASEGETHPPPENSPPGQATPDRT